MIKDTNLTDNQKSFAYRYRTDTRFRAYIDSLRQPVKCRECGIVRSKQTMRPVIGGWECLKSCKLRKLKKNEKRVASKIMIVKEVIKKNTSLTEFI